MFEKMRDAKGGESRMVKKFMSLSAVTLFAFTLTFVGCGKKEEPAPPPPPPPAAPAEPAAPAAPSGEQKAEEPAKDAAPAAEKKEEEKTK
jgi:hypothetical protein